MHFHRGELIFNGMQRPRTARARSGHGEQHELQDKGFIATNEWHDISWEIQLDRMRVVVDGEVRFERSGDYSGIGPRHRSAHASAAHLRPRIPASRRRRGRDERRPVRAIGRSVVLSVIWLHKLEAVLGRERHHLLDLAVGRFARWRRQRHDGAGTLHALKNFSAPAGATMTRIRTCSESIVNECGMSRGAQDHGCRCRLDRLVADGKGHLALNHVERLVFRW